MTNEDTPSPRGNASGAEVQAILNGTILKPVESTPSGDGGDGTKDAADDGLNFVRGLTTRSLLFDLFCHIAIRSNTHSNHIQRIQALSKKRKRFYQFCVWGDVAIRLSAVIFMLYAGFVVVTKVAA
ncbi:hypothetical protein [Arthrobacter luteolus]|uniref:hypothetical protein n=1 Tax=Arthrobacter luteolus TaxID=98672 RepID=UPI00082D016A|nr:hypothetical protein [Arthrobacter luteolus]